jgi:N-methylhydantoinase A
MNSAGGMNTVKYASSFPISIIESGPAAGVLASKFLATVLRLDRVLTFDMGGTTAKAGAVVNGVPDIAHEFEAAGKTHSGRSIKGSGYPVRHPFIDLAEVSTGGGTIAWVDKGGAIRIGPESAGAEPGPAAYGKGGENPTVTDCNIILGRLNPDYLLGGNMRINSKLSIMAIESKVASHLGIGVHLAALGMIRLANNFMAKAISIVSLERGRDPRDYALIAFGGAGPVHACELAEEMHMDTVIVPPHPGLFSAYGLLTLDITREFSFPVLLRQVGALNAFFKQVRVQVRRSLSDEGFSKFYFEEFVDLRYQGQSYELTLPFNASIDLRKEFDKKHTAIYGYSSREPIEPVNAKIRAIVPIKKVRIERRETVQARAKASGDRGVYFGAAPDRVPIYKRDDQSLGSYEKGPCIIEEYDSTTVVFPSWRWSIDGFGNIVIRRER